MTNRWSAILLLGPVIGLTGCGTYDRRGLDPARVQEIETASRSVSRRMSPGLEEKILGLDPAQVTEVQIHEVLSQAPAPRIINIHGGTAAVVTNMVSFAQFLVGMGYPEASLKNPGDGTFTFSCYESSEMIAGVIAWHYERDGLRPMIVGHSQGGMQAVKVLHKLAGHYSSKLKVWSPLTWKVEDRSTVTDPLDGRTRPVVGLEVSYATALLAGGLTRFLPNQWDLATSLRKIRDSVEAFTGFYKGNDLLGGDFLGYGSANHYETEGRAVVRNVELPSEYDHFSIPDTRHLAQNQQIRDWINRYQPAERPELTVTFEADSSHILWAADVWHDIKKHWVLELQRMIRAQRAASRGPEK